MFQDILRNYQKKLVNLSGTNRSLLMLRLSKEHDLDLAETDYLLNKPSFSIIEHLISGKESVTLCNLLDSRNEKVNITGRQLLRIDRKDKFLSEESGARDLCVGWPLIEGKFSEGSPARCPLLFFPVELKLHNNTWSLVLREKEGISFNKTFLLAWEHYTGLKLPDDFDNTSFDSFSQDALEFRTQLYNILKNSALEIDFNSDLFADKLIPFKTWKSDEFEKEHETGRLKLFNTAVLGIFPQASSFLIPDYDQLLNEKRFCSLEELFFKGKDQRIGETHIREADLLTPLLTDAPQEEAIRLAKAGISLVVQGPPGTGKSQLICNLVADFISKGKRVLVVCQKRAALDVVYKRLGTAGAEAFTALVHDFRADRGRLYSQLLSQAEKVDEYKQANSQLNTVVLERDYTDACRKIDLITDELRQFKEALFNEEECGYSVKELYLSHDRSLTGIPETDKYYKFYTRRALEEFIPKLQLLLPYAIRFDSDGYLMQKRKSFRHLQLAHKSQLRDFLTEIERFHSESYLKTKAFGFKVFEFVQYEQAIPLMEEIKDEMQKIFFVRHFERFMRLGRSGKKLRKIRQDFEELKLILNEFASSDFPAGVDRETLNTTIVIVKEAELKHQLYFTKLIWKLASGKRKRVFSLLHSNGLNADHKGLQQLHIRLNNLKEFNHFVDSLKSRQDLDFSETESLKDLIVRTGIVDRALSLAEKWVAEHGSLAFPVQHLKTDGREVYKKIKEFIQFVQKITVIKRNSDNYFQDELLYELFEKQNLTAYKESLERDFDALTEYDREKEKLNFHQLSALEDLIRFSGTHETSAQELLRLFENSIKQHWISHIEMRFPLLTSVSTSKINLLQHQLQDAVKSKRKLSREIMLLKLREQVYRNEEFNRLGNRTTFRDLKHQVSKKKRIWPLRKTIESFAEEVFCLVPCWLASPETVSAVFPLKTMFDLVIFDEASQCFTEKGIPAISRGSQVLITGDSRQLPPSDIYNIRYEEDTNLPDTEVSSLLDLACRYLQQVMLTEHYRSQSLDLISFSNQHFYQNKLRLLPEFGTFSEGQAGIEYIKVNGYFENRQNHQEAAEVVKICLKLFKEKREKDIGVITFNISQQNLIRDLLEEKLAEEMLTLPVSFIIKNIENIQGDEKDIIIFSIGYAPDKAGKMKHNFGSLNMEGGENRLNVAVTRAREKVIVVASLHPAQLQVEETLHKGPKLLKQYLEYALNVSQGRFTPYFPVSGQFHPDWYLKEKLKKNTRYREDLPFADLTERDETGVFVRLVLTDDDRFYSSNSIKETFCYLPEALESKNWSFKQVYSRNYKGTEGSEIL